MNILKRFLPLLFTLVIIANPTFAEDVEGGKDNPRLPRMPGYEITDHQSNDFSQYEFYKSEEETVTKEGRFWKISYQAPEGSKIYGPLEIVRNYANAFKAKGGGSFEYDVYEGGGTGYAWMSEEGKETWVEISTSDAGANYDLTIVETSPMKQQVEIGVEKIVDDLKNKGVVTFYGIHFDTDKSDIKPESAPTVKEIAEALKALPDIKVEIAGHTDNTGDTDHNQKLSQDRANAVMRALTEQHGIDSARLAAKGYGETKPAAGNDTDENKAKNRRVEIIKLP